LPRSSGGDASGGMTDVPTPALVLVAALSQGDDMLTTLLPAALSCQSATVRSLGLSGNTEPSRSSKDRCQAVCSTCSNPRPDQEHGKCTSARRVVRCALCRWLQHAERLSARLR